MLFAGCFLLARAQFRGGGHGRHTNQWGNVGAFATTMVVGALLELAQGVCGEGHCRLRDLLPDAAGAFLGWALLVILVGARARWRRAGPRAAGER